MRSIRGLLVILAGVALLLACGRQGFEPVDSPCQGVTCGGHGICVDLGDSARCVCNQGYHEEGLDCVGDIGVCDGIDCSGHGRCVIQDGRAACLCDSGYHSVGTDCVSDSSGCDGVDCSGHGTCGVLADGSPICSCLPGYHNDGPTACVPDPGSGKCATDADCDDQNVCTDDVCEAAGDCRHDFNQDTCDDGLYCTVNDACDGAGSCSGDPRDCSEASGVCIQGVCNEQAGQCEGQPAADGTPCDDGDPATHSDVCTGMSCAGTAYSCSDNNVCTDDIYHGDGTCSYLNNNLPCDDGDPCSSQDVCQDGGCVGGPVDKDSDGDGYLDAACAGGTDCRDDLPGAHPGATEGPVGDPTCSDGVDNDCDGLVDMQEVSCGGCSADSDCDDANVCTDDTCNTDGSCSHTNNTRRCDDGDDCTRDDVCSGGVCAGTPYSCDDSNVCTDDFCQGDGTCTHTNNTASCDDGDPCSSQDVCAAGACTAGATDKDTDGDGYYDDQCPGGTDCDDGSSGVNPGVFEGPNGDPKCTDGIDNDCDGLTDLQESSCGECNIDADCDDGDVCNGAETCSSNVCQAGTPLTCDDSDPCTDNNCDPVNGCEYPYNTAACDDGNPCTDGDACSGGVCSGLPYSCNDSNVCTDDTCNGDGTCTYVNNTDSCNDSNPCTHTDTCSGGACAGTPYTCSDGNPCTDDVCNGDDTCSFPNNTDSCNDNNPCTQDDVCSGGVCAGASYSCVDGDVCTDDICNGDGTCSNPYNTAACNDGDLCTKDDVCSGGTCAGTTYTCDDTNPCTDDVCDGTGGCNFVNNTAGCDDGEPCTYSDICSGGACSGTAYSCDDSNPCTDDTCNGDGTCTRVNNTAGCDDTDPCTSGDVCSGGSCAGTPYTCTDGNPCTDDECDGVGGCTFPNNTADCNDGNPCTSGDICSGGSCAGTPYTCTDGNPCTNDVCDGMGGCTFPNNTAPCDDGDPCSTLDACSGGGCVAGATNKDTDGDGYFDGLCPDGDDCDDGVYAVNPGVLEGPAGDPKCSDGIDNDCDGLTDLAEASCGMCNVDGDCDDDNVCNGLETCVDNDCQLGTPLDCDDGNPCTDNNCDPITGCDNPFNTDPCDDLNPCTKDDVCSSGACSGTAYSCDDSDVCTDDACNGDGTCTHTNNTASCDDSNPCTYDDTCSGGACSGTAYSCDDSEVCTDDSCDGDGTCTHTYNTASCDDGEDCTENDVCSGGTCSGSPYTCDDFDVCTDNVCDGDGGCLFPYNTASCDDSNPCTHTDTCSGGVCSGTAYSCDDSNVCTEDVCDGSGGCSNPGNTEPCDDGTYCNGTDTCSGGSCSVHSGDPCPPGDECNQCNETAENCYSPAGTSCPGGGGDPCTSGGICDGAGSCVGDPVDCSCYSDQCNEGVCNSGTGLCELQPFPVGTACSPDGGLNPMYCLNGYCTHWCNNSSELPPAAQACPADYRCNSYIDTDSSGYCGPNSGGTKDTGEECTNDNQCRSQYCDTQLSPKRCAGICSSTEDCSSASGWSCIPFQFGVGANRYTHGFCNPSQGTKTTGESCSSPSECRDGYCPSDSPRVCRDMCCTDGECPGDYVCWYEAGYGKSFIKVCTDKGPPRGSKSFGDTCTASDNYDADCNSGLCLDMGDWEERCGRFCCRDSDCPSGYICEFAVETPEAGFYNIRACRLPLAHCCPNSPADQLEADDAGNNAVYWEWDGPSYTAGPGSPESTGVTFASGVVHTIEGTGADNNDDGPDSDNVDVDTFSINTGTAANIHVVLDVAGTGADLDVCVTDTSYNVIACPGQIADGSSDTFDGIFDEDFYMDEDGLFSPGATYYVSVGVYTSSTGLPVDWQLTLCAE